MLDFTSVRRLVIGDVSAVQSVFDRCCEWGLINFTAAAKPAAPALELVADGEPGPAPWLDCTCRHYCSVLLLVCCHY